jgi:hypothetical protein
LQFDIVNASFFARIFQLRRSRRPGASSLIPARRWGGLYRRVGPVVILGLQDDSDKMLSEAMDCRHKEAPTEPGLQVIITFQRGPTRHRVGQLTMRAFAAPVTRFFGRSTNRPVISRVTIHAFA